MEKGNLSINYQTALGGIIYDFFKGVKKSNIDKILSIRHNVLKYEFIIPRKNRYGRRKQK